MKAYKIYQNTDKAMIIYYFMNRRLSRGNKSIKETRAYYKVKILV